MTSSREIRLPVAHPDFRPRRQGAGRTVTHPGTAVRIGDDLFEVMSATPAGNEWIYRLEPWEEGQVSRVWVEWGGAAEGEFLARLRQDRARSRRKSLALGGQVLLGFLPRNVQERLAERLEFDPGRASLYSALLETAVALPPAFLFLLQMLGAGGRFGPIIPSVLGFPALFVLVEGLARLVVTVSSGDPVGGLLLSLVGLRFNKNPKTGIMSDEFLPAGDLLEVVSPSPKAWWERAGGITFGGEPYLLVRSGSEGRYFRYAFRKGGSGFPETDPALERERNIASDRAYALSPLWGFLSRDDQEEVAFYGRYNPRSAVRLSLAINFLLSGALLFPELVRLAVGAPRGWDIVRLVFGAILFGESASRLIRLVQQDKISGSFVGVVIKPVFYLAVGVGPREIAKQERESSPPEASVR